MLVFFFDDGDCYMEMHIKNLKDFEIKDILEKLKKSQNLSGKINIQFAYKGSLVILTTLPKELLKNKVEFQDEIISFLRRMVYGLNFDTDMERMVDVELTFLNDFEEALTRWKDNTNMLQREENVKKNSKEVQVALNNSIEFCQRCVSLEIKNNEMYRMLDRIAYNTDTAESEQLIKKAMFEEEEDLYYTDIAESEQLLEKAMLEEEDDVFCMKTKEPEEQFKRLYEVDKDSSGFSERDTMSTTDNFSSVERIDRIGQNDVKKLENEQIEMIICAKCDVSLYENAYWCKICQFRMCEKCISTHQLQNSFNSQNITYISISEYGLEISRKTLEHEIMKVLYYQHSEFELLNSFVIEYSEIRCIGMLDDQKLVLGFPDKLKLFAFTTSDENVLVKLKKSPWDLAVIGKNEIVVCYGSEKFISIIDIKSRKISNEISIEEECYGIEYKYHKLYAGSFSGVTILSVDGSFTKKVAINGFSPYCFCITDNNFFFYTHYAENKIVCINEDGNLINTYTYPNMTKPCGIICDENDNIFVAFGGSSTIYKIRPTSTEFNVIFSFCPSLTSSSKPMLCYNSMSKFLVATNFDQLGIVRIFKQRILFQ